jgi:peptidoglycan/LPS O-acetylase OafA/YrhL
MEHTPDISSEEELSRLRDEGKVSEAEYEELRAAMRTTAERERKSEAPEQPRSKRRRGKIAFALMLVGIIGPFLLYSAVNLLAPPEPNWGRSPGTELLAALALEVAAFAMGISAWPDVFAKAAVVVSGFCVVVFVLFVAQPYVF